MISNLFHNTLIHAQMKYDMGTRLLSGLSQAGAAWIRAAMLHDYDPREFFPRVGGWADPSFTAPLAETKHEETVVLLQLGFIAFLHPRVHVCMILSH